MAFINEFRNNIDESIEYYNKSYQLNRCSRSSYSLGKIFYYKKEYDKALTYFLDSSYLIMNLHIIWLLNYIIYKKILKIVKII